MSYKVYDSYCKKCKRRLSPWPIPHPLCSPPGWVLCITTNPDREELREVTDWEATDWEAHVSQYEWNS
jgi:hypothetical protein